MPVSPFTAIPKSLLALAPTYLPNYRRDRYSGDSLYVRLEQLAERDRDLLAHFYKILTELLFVTVDSSTEDPQKWEAIVSWSQRHDLDQFIDNVRELGLVSLAQTPGEELSKAMHDVRGGPLSALLGRLQLLESLPHDEGQLKAIFVHTRDHLKIMRNAIVGLDERRREADRTPKSHSMQLILDKWHTAIVGPNWHTRPIRMEIDCRHTGTLTECCLESAAIDRIFYNLAGNACRHAVDSRLEMLVFPLSNSPGESLRFILSNAVSQANVDSLRSLAGGKANRGDGGAGLSLPSLFEPTVSSTGSGFGLTVVADFVTDAFGLRNRAQALRERYVGAVLDGRTFRVWFHWPMAHDHLPEKLDDYHRPEQSLSEP